MATFRRRKYWVDVRSQAPLLIKIGVLWAAGILLLSLLLFYLSDEELGRSFYSIHLRLRNTWQILLPAVLISSGITFLLIILATLYIVLRETHRLGGPVFKFRRLFKELEDGYLDTDFHFRTGDLLIDLGESYRSALASTRERIVAIQQLSRLADANVQALHESLDRKGLDPASLRLLEETVSVASRLNEASRTFHAEKA